jgi:hypothetical protein
MDAFTSLLDGEDIDFVNSLLQNEIENPFDGPPPIQIPVSSVQHAAEHHIPLSPAPRSPVRSGEIAKRCVAIYVGGTSLQPGKTELTDVPHFCSNLSCLNCDHIVLRFADSRWKPSVDYMFLRLNYPNRLDTGIYPAPGFCAFCCQCTSREEDRLQKLNCYSSNWVCRGHL